MAATPYKGILNLVSSPGGPTIQSEAFYGPDVANDYIQWYSNGQLDFVIVKNDCFIDDIKLSAAGVDTARLQLFINGVDVNHQFLDAGIVSTVNNRMNNAIGPIKAGSMVQLKELA
jgi:hypothetical protein